MIWSKVHWIMHESLSKSAVDDLLTLGAAKQEMFPIIWIKYFAVWKTKSRFEYFRSSIVRLLNGGQGVYKNPPIVAADKRILALFHHGKTALPQNLLHLLPHSIDFVYELYFVNHVKCADFDCETWPACEDVQQHQCDDPCERDLLEAAGFPGKFSRFRVFPVIFARFRSRKFLACSRTPWHMSSSSRTKMTKKWRHIFAPKPSTVAGSIASRFS